VTEDRFSIDKATQGDIPSLTRLHRVVFDGTIGVALGEKYSSNFIEWFVCSSKAIVLVAREDEMTAGYVFGALNGYASEMNRALLGVIFGALLTHPCVICDPRLLRQIPARLRSLLRLPSRSIATSVPVSDPTSRVYRLTAIGVSPRYRKRGLGKMLMEAYEQRVWDLGFDMIHLSVYSQNHEARRLYERCGWYPVSNNGRLITFAKHRVG
jgi:ribosomal protein S18 acetylase RimI-like enzyme